MLLTFSHCCQSLRLVQAGVDTELFKAWLRRKLGVQKLLATLSLLNHTQKWLAYLVYMLNILLIILSCSLPLNFAKLLTHTRFSHPRNVMYVACTQKQWISIIRERTLEALHSRLSLVVCFCADGGAAPPRGSAVDNTNSALTLWIDSWVIPCHINTNSGGHYKFQPNSALVYSLLRH